MNLLSNFFRMSETNEIIVSIKNNVQIIVLNRPRVKNALNKHMYKTLTSILNRSAKNEDIIACVLTGSGDYYSSGNDISNFTDSASEDPIPEARSIIQAFVEAFINYPKLLIAVMNGPAIGIAATTLALFDVVYASEKAFLQTPFIKLGLSPEGCSTYTFPKLFGPSKATEVLLFGKKMSIQEAHQYGLVSEIYSSNDKLEEIWNKIYSLSSLPKNSLIHSKNLLKTFDKDSLILANIKECNELEGRWQSEEFFEAIAKFMSRSKL